MVDKLHRIDPEVVKRDFAKPPASSWRPAATSLHNAADDHSLLVFDPAIRGKTDRFIIKFKKPR